MRFLALLIVLALATGAQAASKPGAKKFVIMPPAKSAQAGLKGSAAPVPAVVAAPILGPTPSPLRMSALESGITIPGRNLGRGLSGLPATGDPAPICRAACAQERYTCLSADDESCDHRWSRCVAGCTGR